jgi:hypothetical protein
MNTIASASCIPVNIDFRTARVKWMDLKHFQDLPLLDTRTIASLDQYTFETGFEALYQRGFETPALKPSGFIFHTSRCGSTLVSKILQKGSNALVLVEPQPINTLLVGFTGPPQGNIQNAEWEETGYIMMKRVFFAYLNTGFRVFIKFSSFNILLIHRILKIWTDVPVLFLYRNPIEVVVSNLEKHGGFMRKRSAPQLRYILQHWGIALSDNLSAEEYCVRMVNLFFYVIEKHMQDANPANTMLKDYDTIDFDAINEVLRFFSVQLHEDTIADCMRRDAKSDKVFSSDKALKQAKASKIVYNLCRDLALPNYCMLKAISTKIF